MEYDVVNKAKHYNTHASGIEAIEVVRHLSFGLGSAVKYAMRRNGKEKSRSLLSAIYYVRDNLLNGIEEPPSALSAVPVLQQYAFAEVVEEARDVYHAVVEYVKFPSPKSGLMLITALQALKDSDK